MQKHTHREYLTWLTWLENEWERPGIVPQYLMLVCAVLRRCLLSDSKAQPKDFKLTFKHSGKPKPRDPEEVTRIAKARRWGRSK